MSSNLFESSVNEAAGVISTLLSSKGGSPAITCSFQIEDMVVLHMLRQHVPDIPVLFLDTGYHFPETYEYRDRITKLWKLNLVNVVPKQTVSEQETQFGILYHSDPTRCCQMRKVAPLMAALQNFELWFTGLRREQSPTRRNLQIVDSQQLPGGKQITKVNPLALWDTKQVWRYIAAHNIEYLLLYDRGYTSIGCAPCTSIPDKGADPRSGRWGGAKLECGIHVLSNDTQ